jgi:hypothetical protein
MNRVRPSIAASPSCAAPAVIACFQAGYVRASARPSVAAERPACHAHAPREVIA